MRRPLAAILLITIALSLASSAMAMQGPPPGDPGGAGVQTLTQGPIHEAFAEPVVFDPQPGPVVPKPPPQPIEESPPDQKPDGENVQWISGYWAWDDSRNDFLWISGIWRNMPPGRQWVPGYWSRLDNGFRWVPGAWTALVAQGAQDSEDYLPAPPASLEAGPNSPQPAAGAVWAPGYWTWRDTHYAWRPGFWTEYRPNWLWVPAHYVWTPGGYLFVAGYWDRPILQRGTPFAPVYFTQPVYQQQNYVYTPSIGLLAASLVSSLFVRPSCHQYYFGDYYAANNFQSGIYPWYSFHQSHYGYDPIFAHYAATNVRDDPRWLDHMHDEYVYRRDNPDARPAHTYVEQQTNIRNVTNVTNIKNVTLINNSKTLVMAQPLTQIAARPAAGQSIHYTTLAPAQKQEIVKQSRDLQQFQQQRLRQETAAVKQGTVPPGPTGARSKPSEPVPPGEVRPKPPESGAPLVRRVDVPRSPIVAAGHLSAPAAPQRPPVDTNAKPHPQGAAPIRPMPRPDVRPQPQPGGRPGAGPTTPNRPESRPSSPTPKAAPPRPPASSPGREMPRPPATTPKAAPRPPAPTPRVEPPKPPAATPKAAPPGPPSPPQKKAEPPARK